MFLLVVLGDVVVLVVLSCMVVLGDEVVLVV